MYYLFSIKKGADQMRDYRPANLGLSFGILKLEDQWSCKRSPDILA